MEEVEFINPNFIVTQKINQIGKVLNEIKEKQTEILCNNQKNGNNMPDYVKLQLIKEQATGDSKNYTQQIKILQEENKNRILFLKKPIVTANYQPEQEKKFKKLPAEQQVENIIHQLKQKISNFQKEKEYDILNDCLKVDEEVIPLTKRRSNASVLIKKNSNSYEYIYTNYQTNCLQGIQFGLDSNLLTNHYNINVKKQIEYNPLKKASTILGLNKISINEQEYLQVRCIYNLHHLKINEKNEIQFKGVESSYYSDENGNYKELLDCVQSNFFEEEQFVLGEGNYIYKQTNLNQNSIVGQLKQLKSNVESIDVSYHPQSLYLQMTDSVGLYDMRAKEPNIVLQVPTKKVPMHRIYGLKYLEDNYFMVSTTQHFKIYDIRCTNYPVYSVSHGSDECPPTIINIHTDPEQEDEDNDLIDAFLHDESIHLMQKRTSNRSERIITSFSPHKNGDILFMRWRKGSTLLESLYEDKHSKQTQSHFQNKNRESLSQNLSSQQKSDQSIDESGQDDTKPNKKGNDFNFNFLSSIKNEKRKSKSDKQRNIYDQNSSMESNQRSQSQNKNSSVAHEDNDDQSDSEENNKKLQKHQVLGRENKGERFCFNQEVKNLFQPKGILASSQISDVLKIRGVCATFFEDQNKFFTLQNDSKGGVSAQIFCNKNDSSPSTSSYVPLKAVSSSTTSVLDIGKNDSQLNSITDLQVMKIFEKPEFTDQNTTNEELITLPVRLRKQKKKQVNMFPYFNYLRDQVDVVKTTNLDEINKFIEQQQQKKKQHKLSAQKQQKSVVESVLNSQISGINIQEMTQNEDNNEIKEIIQEQNNLLSVYHDKLAYPEFRKNMKYNTKNILTQKISEVLQQYWD